jgi:hypothetical protein
LAFGLRVTLNGCSASSIRNDESLPSLRSNTMLAASPDLINSIEINAKAFMTLSKIAFSSVERLATLNLNATRLALGDRSAAFGALSKTLDVSPQGGPLGATPAAATHNAAAYLKGVQEIAAETQREVSALISSYFAAQGAGANPSAGWLKGFEQFKSFAQQVTDMTTANSKVVGDATARIAGSAASLAQQGS